MVHPDFFDDVRMPVLRATDRLRALAPVIEKALRHHYGPKWRKALAQQARQAGRSPSGLYDPRYLLRLIVHEPALANVFDDSARDKARRLSAMANFVAHCDHRRLQRTDRLTAGVFVDGLLKAAGLEVEQPQPPIRPDEALPVEPAPDPAKANRNSPHWGVPIPLDRSRS